jgi:hypothetical protein
VEPAAVLVGTFQVQVGARAGGVADVVRATQHVPVSGTGVEPDVQGIGDLVVLAGFVTQQFGGVQLEPGFDAFLLDALGHASISSTVRGCSSPVCLCRKNGIGTPQLR